jgi:Pentapeptide repeats (8 copies)
VSSAPYADPEKFGVVEPTRTRWPSKLIPRRRATRWGAAAAVLFVAVVILLYLSIAVLPETIVERPTELNQLEGNQRVQAENALEQTRNSVRTTLIQAVGGGVLFLTFAAALAQLFITREGQLVDRFTKSIDQLGEADKIDVRMGGIYALKQIAERHEYRRPIADIFVAYLKTHSPATGQAASSTGGEASVPGSTEAGEEVRLRPDLQAVLRILVGEGEELWRRAGISRLDLSYIVVRNADLPGVDLSNVVLLHANLDGSNLSKANMRDADLRHASFIATDLSGADFANANLSYARLSHARLVEAHLNEALLKGAQLDGAELREAHLEFADATEANFAGAGLTNADLRRAVLTDANFAEANLGGAKLQGANLENARGLAEMIHDETTIMDETTRARIDEPYSDRR